MKIGPISIASIVLLIFAMVSFITRHFFQSTYASLSPYYDGALVGAMVVIIVQYASVYINAWINNRKESK